MTQTVNPSGAATPVAEPQPGAQDLALRVGQLEAETRALEQENKALRTLLERVVEFRQRSHSELVLLLTSLVGKLPLNDIGVIVSKLVEHNTNVTQTLGALAKGATELELPQPVVLKTLEQTKHDLAASLKPLIEELLRLEAPFESGLLEGMLKQPDTFFSPRMTRANRCFIKGQVPRERIVREFGEAALVLFNDLTTDPRLNPNPKPEEIVLGFKNDFETLLQQNPGLPPDKRAQLVELHQRVQRCKAPTEAAHAQRVAFQKLTFLVELLYYYEHQNTEAPDVLFAQRLPALVEQLVQLGPQDQLEEKPIALAESLLGYIISPDHRQMVVNNLGKSGGIAKTLKYVLRLRAEKVPDLDEVVTEFVRHLIPPSPQKPPTPEKLAGLLRLIPAAMQRFVVRAIMSYDRIRKQDAEALGKAVGEALGLKGLEEQLKTEAALPPDVERQMAWERIKDSISHRTDPAGVAGAIRERLNAKYNADEIRQSWITLTEADPMSLIRIFCHLPYLASGKTDPIARTVLETYVTRLMHEKYASVYHKVVNSLRNVFKAKPDSPTLVNFLALVRWVDPQSADRLSADIGMAVAAHAPT